MGSFKMTKMYTRLTMTPTSIVVVLEAILPINNATDSEAAIEAALAALTDYGSAAVTEKYFITNTDKEAESILRSREIKS